MNITTFKSQTLQGVIRIFPYCNHCGDEMNVVAYIEMGIELRLLITPCHNKCVRGEEDDS